MKTFSMFFSEDAGEKFRAMDDSQFADWKKNNPGASKKADELRSGKKTGLQNNDAKDSKELPTSAITTTKGGALDKHRKSEMGKWSQGIKNSPDKLAKKAETAMTKKEPEKPSSSAIVKRDDIENVDVKDVTPKKVEDEKQQLGNQSAPKSDMADKQRARINKNTPVKVPDSAKKAVKGLKKGAGVVANMAKKLAAKSKGSNRGIATSGDLGGLSGRSKGLLS